MLVLACSAFQTSFAQTGPEILFNKAKYGPFDTVTVLIKNDEANSNAESVEILTANIFTTSMNKMERPGQKLLLPETGENTGYFKTTIKLTPDSGIWSGDITVQRDDDLIVEYKISDNKILTGKVDVDFYASELIVSEPTYNVTDAARIIVIDVDGNMHPDTIDTLPVRVWSSTDRGGLLLTLRETGASTGIFEEFLTFTLDEESTGNRLRVSEGDTITVKYTDDTLPAPAALSENGFHTVEVEELFASASIGYIVPVLERAVASELMIVDNAGESLTRLIAGQNALVQCEVTNGQKKDQLFTYIVQIKDVQGETISLSWVTGELPSLGSMNVSQSWTPVSPGIFSLEAFVWEGIDNATALSPVRSATIKVL